jgi:phage FluMu gp28-like protein
MNWKNPYPATDPRSLMLEYQLNLRSLAHANRFVFGLWSRQTGKDFTCAEIAVEDCMANPKTQWMVVAPSERQSLESVEKCKDFATAFNLMIEEVIEERDAPQALIKSSEIRFANGSRIRALPGKPSTVRGLSSNVVFTEFAFFEDPEQVWRAAYPSITNPLRGGAKRVIIITTPNGKGNKAYDLWCKTPEGALEQGLVQDPDKKIRWLGNKVTVHDAIRMGLPLDLEELREGMDSPEGFAQEYECEFIDTSNVLLPYDLIALAESAAATEATDMFNGPTLGGGSGPIYLGIDFGRTTDPTVCWALQQEGELLVTREVLVLRGMSTPDQIEALRPRIRSAARVCWDYTGPGIGGGDELAREFGEFKPDGHAFGKVELCTFTTPFKRDIFPKMRRAFEAPTRVRIPISIAIREDLHAMRQVVKNGEYSYSAPRTAEGHSDRCTGLALAVRAASGGAGCAVSKRIWGFKNPPGVRVNGRFFPTTPNRSRRVIA